MQFDSFADFINMGGYGFYVWLSFGAGLVLILGLIIQSFVAHNSVKNTIAKKLMREQKLKKAAANQAAANK